MVNIGIVKIIVVVVIVVVRVVAAVVVVVIIIAVFIRLRGGEMNGTRTGGVELDGRSHCWEVMGLEVDDVVVRGDRTKQVSNV